jgi:hypothetical protein
VLATSFVAVATLAYRPDFVEAHFHTPAATLLAMAASIGPLVLALQILRDLVRLILCCIAWALRFEIKPKSPLSEGIATWSRRLGLWALVACIYVHPFIGEDRDRYRVRVADPAASLREPNGICNNPLAERPAQPSRPGRPCLDEALLNWRQARLDRNFPKTGDMPLIIVTAEGGASRAAIWLLAALRMLDQQTGGLSGESIFAISSVSGGSLGAVTYLQMVAKQNRHEGGLDWSRPDVRNGLRDLGHGDLLAASISTYFLNDAVARLMGVLWSGSDRGVVLEMAFERNWAATGGFNIPEASVKMGLLQLRRSASGLVPHLLLNGTDRETGGRIITSTFRFDTEEDVFSASTDFFGVVGCDIPASTAVMNSARFPFVSPAGRFSSGCNGKDGMAKQVLDGGYFENYGARTAAELARKIRLLSHKYDLHLVPIVVVVSNDADGLREAPGRKEREEGKQQIDDVTVTCVLKPPLLPEAASQRDSQGTGIVPETSAVLFGQLATRGAHGQDALHILRRTQCPDLDDDRVRFIHIALPVPEGDEAAPMNWVLNPRACDYLLNKAPTLPFNKGQVKLLEATFMAMNQKRPPLDDKDGGIDCTDKRS